jgi:hypothetical protein
MLLKLSLIFLFKSSLDSYNLINGDSLKYVYSNVEKSVLLNDEKLIKIEKIDFENGLIFLERTEADKNKGFRTLLKIEIEEKME